MTSVEMPVHPVTGEPLAPPDDLPAEPSSPGWRSRLAGRLRRPRPEAPADGETDETSDDLEPAGRSPRGSFFRRFWTRSDAGAGPEEESEIDLSVGETLDEEESLDEAPARRWRLSRRGRIGLAVGISAVVLGSVGVAKWTTSGQSADEQTPADQAATPPDSKRESGAPAVASTKGPASKPPATPASRNLALDNPAEEATPPAAPASATTDDPPVVVTAPPPAEDPLDANLGPTAGLSSPAIESAPPGATDLDASDPVGTYNSGDSPDGFVPPPLPTASSDPAATEVLPLDAPPPVTASAPPVMEPEAEDSIPGLDSVPPLVGDGIGSTPPATPVGIADLPPVDDSEPDELVASPPFDNALPAIDEPAGPATGSGPGASLVLSGPAEEPTVVAAEANPLVAPNSLGASEATTDPNSPAALTSAIPRLDEPTEAESSPEMPAAASSPALSMAAPTSKPAGDSRYPTAEERAQWIPIPNAAQRRVAQASISSAPTSVAMAGPASAATSVALPAGWQRHVVLRDENFWTISRTYYNTGKHYRALWQANRDHVPRIDELYVGTELLIPPVEELPSDPISGGLPERDSSVRLRSHEVEIEGDHLDEPAGAGEVQQADFEEPAAAAEPTASRGPARTLKTVHVVKANETLRSIARSRLGDPDRAEELYLLNERKIRDPRSIPPGLVLELPAGP